MAVSVDGFYTVCYEFHKKLALKLVKKRSYLISGF